MKSGLHKQFKTNSTKEVEGVRIEFPEAQNDNGTIPTFIISRMGKANPVYSKALEAVTRPYRRQVELGTMKNEVAENLFKKVFVDTVLKGWENVQDESGEALEFTEENALNLIKELPDVYERLQVEAGLASNFRDETLSNEAKN